MFYSLVPIVSFIVVFILNIDFFSSRYLYSNKKALIAYRALLISAFAYLFSDLMWGILNNVKPTILVEIDTAFYFVTMSVLVFSWMRFVVIYLETGKVVKNVMLTAGYLILSAGVVLVIVNFFKPVLFSYETESYDANLGRYIFLFVQEVVYFVTSLLAAFRIVILKQKRKLVQSLAIIFATIVMVISTTLQIAFPLQPMYSIGCLVALTIVHIFIAAVEKNKLKLSRDEALTREKEQSQELSAVKELAYRDPLTGVKNKHSYVEYEEYLDKLIREKRIDQFCLAVFDLNDLKLINDTYGHEMGDKYIQKSCSLIQEYFKASEIFRFGGDEFIVILKDKDYDDRFKFMEAFNVMIENNIGTQEPIIACGFSDFIPSKDNTVRAVFTRADDKMYSRKKRLKEMSNLDSRDKKQNNNSYSGNIMNLRLKLYETFYKSSDLSLIEALNNSSCDEIIDVDLRNDSFKQTFRIKGKYFVPIIDGSYRSLVDFSANHIVHPDDKGIYLDLMSVDNQIERLKNSRIPNFDFAHFRYKLQDGGYRYVEQCVITGEENGFAPGTFRIVIIDINNIKTRQLGIPGDETGVISVGKDQLTGLLTGKEFFIKGDQKVKENPDKQWCLISLDIEHFKFFCEWYGRDKGNMLLAAIGGEILENERTMDGVGGYFGQDDFALLCEYDSAKIKNLYSKIKDHIDGFGLTGGFLPAFGVAMVDNSSLVDVLDRSSIAAAEAKKDIANRICEYNVDMHQQSEHEYHILTDFMTALQNDEITFFLQPQCRISTGNIVGAEALARWIKKDGTIIYPDDFIPILEKYNFITVLDKQIWEKVCIWLKEMIDDKKPIVPVSLNVSRVDVFNIDLEKHFHDLTEKYSIPHKYLKIEITESAYAESSDKIERLVEKLHKDGFVVLMDDFGSGYSSLNMLSNLKIDAIKLDANFLHIEGADHNKGIRILESVINMAKTMALPIIVEGVENKSQCDFLSGLGCRYVQGFFFYRPMPYKDLQGLIKDGKKIDERGFVVKVNEQFRIREFLDKNIYSDSMLNEILGAVAIYSYVDNHVDIIRYNQQFYLSVGVPDFAERLVNIERFLVEEDHQLLFDALKKAKENKLGGYAQLLRFVLTNGSVSCFQIHFYYVGKKEGSDRFYGSAENVSSLMELQDEKKVISKYSDENLILVRKIDNKWNYSVVSHALADVFKLSPQELEEEMNNGKFALRVSIKEMKQFMDEANKHAENKESFVSKIAVNDHSRKKVNIEMAFDYVGDECNNITYVLRTRLLDK